MKTLIKSLAIAFSLGIVTSAATFSEAKPIVRPAAVAAYKTGIYTTVDGRLSIALDKQTGGAVDIKMTNDAGKVMYSERLGKNESKYRIKLDMSQLPDGVYQVEITNGAETTIRTVTLSTEQPSNPGRLVAIK
ncbi:T9SS type A sorting domain-containing protein [Spirosoma sp.]|uniref:T9SS type A sorting domain-containing protein n=1 Tax=Spirosoma sp. TaxID=1899569 RepID=UPI003B3B2057